MIFNLVSLFHREDALNINNSVCLWLVCVSLCEDAHIHGDMHA